MRWLRLARTGGFALVCSGLLLPTQSHADCEGGEPFGQTIRIDDPSVLDWAEIADVDYVKGDLSQVASYSSLVRGALPGTTFLDISNDNPAPGTGLFYLVKRSSPPCGSWQTSAGTETDRDLQIKSGCSGVTLTDDEIDVAVQNALTGLANPWGDRDDFLVMQQRLQEGLDCAFEEDLSQVTNSEALTSDP